MTNHWTLHLFFFPLFLRVVREIPDDLGILKTDFSRNKSGNKEIIIYKRAIFSVAYSTILRDGFKL